MAARKAPKSRIALSELASLLDRLIPPALAEEWDSVGLQVGRPESKVQRVLTALEVSRETLAEAVEAKAQALVVHHPLLFRPVGTLTERDATQQLAAEAIRRDIAVYTAHTNLDSVPWGTNGVLADLVGLGDERRPLHPADVRPPEVKIAIFVPTTHIQPLIDALAGAGAGVIGDYTHCTFRTPGTGTFRPGEGANPYQGTVGAFEEAEEVRLETVCPRGILPRVVAAARAAHPYEEMAYDVYTLVPGDGPATGLGLRGALATPTTVVEVAERLREALGLSSVGVVGDPKAGVTEAMVLSGSGGSVVRRWHKGMPRLLVTGEMTHHDCHEARHRGLNVVLVGHFASEAIVAPRLAERLGEALAGAGYGGVEVRATERERDPLARH